MQQRRLRPGDVLDDYCPRERRVTDHAIVAMIDDEIKQTRCVSCDAEHGYKQGRVPPQRRKKASPALFSQVLDGLNPPSRPAHAAAGVDEPDSPPNPPSPVEDSREARWPEPPAVAAPSALAPEEPSAPAPEPAPLSADDFEDGAVRRPLIRAQLPRLEGQPPPARSLPDFTIRQAKNGRGGGRPPGGGHRHAGGRRRNQDHQAMNGPPRFGGSRPQGQGRGGDRSQGAGGWSGNRADRGRGRGGKKPR